MVRLFITGKGFSASNLGKTFLANTSARQLVVEWLSNIRATKESHNSPQQKSRRIKKGLKGKNMENITAHVAELFDKGGAVMWVILVVSVYGGALVFERWLKYRATEKATKAHLDIVNAAKTLTEENVAAMKGATPTGRIAKTVWEARGLDRESVAEKARTRFMTEGGHIEKRLGGVAVIASLLPMIGLLGTVVGMITAFNAIALHGTGDPKILADGISQALLTTEAGLITSIPLMYLHHVLSDKADLLTRRLDAFTMHILHIYPAEAS